MRTSSACAKLYTNTKKERPASHPTQHRRSKGRRGNPGHNHDGPCRVRPKPSKQGSSSIGHGFRGVRKPAPIHRPVDAQRCVDQRPRYGRVWSPALPIEKPSTTSRHDTAYPGPCSQEDFVHATSLLFLSALCANGVPSLTESNVRLRSRMHSRRLWTHPGQISSNPACNQMLISFLCPLPFRTPFRPASIHMALNRDLVVFHPSGAP